jgi:pimeloyl-ACP methyl ester carboxylesterase
VSVSALADQLERDLDRAAIDRAHLVGNSLGGWLSLELAARGRALSVVALSPALGWEQDRGHLKRLATKLRVGRKLYAAANPYAEFLLASKRIRKVLLRGAIAHAERLSVVEAAAFLRDNLRCEIYFELMDSFLSTEHQLGDIDCPVLIAWAAYDALIPKDPYGVRFPSLVPHADFATLPSVGHVPMYDDPDLVARTILDYTATVDRGCGRHRCFSRIDLVE